MALLVTRRNGAGRLSEPRTQIWVGVEASKGRHWAVVLDEEGGRLLSRKVVNDEAAILEMIAAVAELADQAVWAVDISGKAAALLLALLAAHGREVVYVPGRTVNRMGVLSGRCHRSACLWTFPEAVRGKSSTKRTVRGIL